MKLLANLKGRQAYRLHGEGKLEEARKLYEEGMAEGMDNPHYLLAYSTLMVRAGHFAEMREYLVKLQHNPGLTDEMKTQLFINYAACVYKLGELDKGIRLLERQHAHRPTGALYQTLGYLYVEKYDAEHAPDFDALDREAREAYEQELARRQAEDAQPEEGGEAEKPLTEPVPAREQWAAGIAKAQAFLEKAVDYDDEDPICLDNMGQFWYRVKGDRAEARSWFDRAIAERDSQIDTLWFLSRYDLEAGDTARALERLQKAVNGSFSVLNYKDKASIEAEIARLQARA